MRLLRTFQNGSPDLAKPQRNAKFIQAVCLGDNEIGGSLPEEGGRTATRTSPPGAGLPALPLTYGDCSLTRGDVYQAIQVPCMLGVTWGWDWTLTS